MASIKRGKVFSINISKAKGVPKTPIKSVRLIENLGLEADAHAQEGIKQVSLLAVESITKQNSCPKVTLLRNKQTGSSSRKRGSIKSVLKPGDFAENITTEGIELVSLKVGSKITIGSEVVMQVSKIGKDCHKYCAIYYKTGDCIMPREGIFAQVLKGGIINAGDSIEVVEDV
ncbi:MAG: MOSC domain-containing protein [Candidatus Omnitrophota bacterium]